MESGFAANADRPVSRPDVLSRLDLSQRSAIVTGAGRGIGRATASALAALGANVALLARDLDSLKSVAGEIEALGGSAEPHAVDVTDFSAADSVVRDVAGRSGIDILVNNVGGAPWVRALEDTPTSEFEYALSLNLTATHNMMRAAAEALFESTRGPVVVNVASIAASSGLEQMSFYSAAKAGVVGVSRAAAREWGPRGVRVNCVAPGWIDTDLSSGLRDTPSFFDRTIEAIPMRRWGRPEEVGAVIAFLASDAAAYINGAVVYADGGLLA